MVDKVVESRPDLLIIAFGMNDSAGRPAGEYHKNSEGVIAGVRRNLPDAEFILVATMLGNRGWTRLRHELFAEYRDALATLKAPTSPWPSPRSGPASSNSTGLGPDRQQMNHPNDFGHRVYAQVITSLLVPDDRP
ncbi:MAG: SGNH/GDSL hydrolase family protein [Isosphaeraceae bacterium]